MEIHLFSEEHGVCPCNPNRTTVTVLENKDILKKKFRSITMFSVKCCNSAKNAERVQLQYFNQ